MDAKLLFGGRNRNGITIRAVAVDADFSAGSAGNDVTARTKFNCATAFLHYRYVVD